MNDFVAAYWPFLSGAMGVIALMGWVYRTGRKAIGMLQRLSEILSPNGGTSLADKINDMHRWEKESRAMLKEHSDRLTTIERALVARTAEERAG